MYPHRIRLRGPWDYEPLVRLPTSPVPLPPPGRMVLPCRWAEGGLTDFSGRVRFRRRFGYPGQIDADERVWLTFAGVSNTAAVVLNSFGLGDWSGEAPAEFDVTSLLRPRNELLVEVEGGSAGGIQGEVALEIRCTAFLRQVQVRPVVTDAGLFLDVSGVVVGPEECVQPFLELYVVLNRYNVGYGRVAASPQGQPFQLRSDLVSWERWRGEEEESRPVVQIDLVKGALVWYRVSEELPDPPAAPEA